MTSEMMVKMMRVPLLLLTMLATSLRGVSAAYYIDVPIDTPMGAAVTAVIMTLIVVSILSYFYSNLKEQAGGAAGLSMFSLTAKLHYTDTGYGRVVQHHQRTSSQQFYKDYNKFTTIGQKIATSQHLDMSRCWALALRCGKFVVRQVVELL